jgi:hypothetical protein
MRSLPEVLSKMTTLIPDDTGHLRNRLESVRTSALYAPPEMQGYWWRAAQTALIECEPEAPEEDWWRKVLAIWRGE